MRLAPHLLISCVFVLAACKAAEPPNTSVKPETSPSSSAVTADDPASKNAQEHKGMWPLIEGEIARTVWADGIWTMQPPDCLNAAKPAENSIVIANYSDFNFDFNGESLAKLLGPYNWSWSDDKFDEPDAGEAENDIKVVIFRNAIPEDETRYGVINNALSISRAEAQARHPVNKAKNLDFRYVAYSELMDYLDEAAAKMPQQALAETLVKRKFEIRQMFCAQPQ